MPPTGAPSATDRPLVSIGVPVYNEARYLSATLDSLLSQDYENFELIISDNASDDATPQICAEFAGKDRRVRYERADTQASSLANHNRVFGFARGEYFSWASGHDLRDPSFLSRCMDVLVRDPSVALCYPAALLLGPDGQRAGAIRTCIDTRGIRNGVARLTAVLWRCTTGIPLLGVVRSHALRRTRLHQDVLAPDIALLGELALIGAFAAIPEPLLYARMLPDHGSWERYVEKHFRQRLTGRSLHRLYWRMASDLSRSVAAHTQSPLGRALGMLSAVLCVLVRAPRWLLPGLHESLLRRLGRAGP